MPLFGLDKARAEEVRVTGLPAEPRITGVSWSPDGERIAFVVTVDDQLSLWYADLKNGKARQVTSDKTALNATYGRPYSWLADSESFVARVIPAGRGPAPEESDIPTGPVVQENLARLYQRTGNDAARDAAIARWQELTGGDAPRPD